MIDIICIVYIIDMIYYQLFHIKRQSFTGAPVVNKNKRMVFNFENKN